MLPCIASAFLTFRQGVEIGIQEYNMLPRISELPASNKWPVKGLSLGPCGMLNFPMGLAVFEGHYVLADIVEYCDQTRHFSAIAAHLRNRNPNCEAKELKSYLGNLVESGIVLED